MTEQLPFEPGLVAVDPAGDLATALELPARPLHIEVGFGKDVRVLRAAAADPGTLYLGIEVSRKKHDKFCRKVARAGLRNVRALLCDVREVLQEMLPPACVLSFTVLFPDPWPKRRHHKHRWITPESAPQLARALVPDGCVTVATDDAPYMDQIRASMRSAGFRLERETATVPALERSLFAERFERLGAPVLYQLWLRG